jgi:hypothetical protein
MELCNKSPKYTLPFADTSFLFGGGWCTETVDRAKIPIENILEQERV